MAFLRSFSELSPKNLGREFMAKAIIRTHEVASKLPIQPGEAKRIAAELAFLDMTQILAAESVRPVFVKK